MSPDYLAQFSDLSDLAHEGEFWAAWLDQRVVGALVVLDNNGLGYVRHPQGREIGFRLLGVDPDLRGHGIARALVDQVVQLGLERGAQAVHLYTAPFMTAAHHLYETYGFIREPTRDSTAPGVGHPLWAYTYSVGTGPVH
jgi:ribosomal protein S18 acetylase RimI-like enzyme